MGCYLRVYGAELDVDRLVVAAGLNDADDVITVARRGEPRLPKTQPDGTKVERSGINIRISSAGFHELETQVEDAIATLRDERELILTLGAFDGVEDIMLDFGIERRDCFAQFDYFPAELIRLAGQLGLSLEISHYPASRRPEEGQPSVRG